MALLDSDRSSSSFPAALVGRCRPAPRKLLERPFQRPQRCRHAPAGRLFEIPNAPLQTHVERPVPTRWIGEKCDRAFDIDPGAEQLGETPRRVDRDIVQPMQLIDDHELDQLIGAEGPERRKVRGRLIGLVYRISAEQDAQRRRLADTILSDNCRKTFRLQRTLKTRARDAVEGKVEDQKTMAEKALRDGREMSSRIDCADAEIGLRLDAEHARGQ